MAFSLHDVTTTYLTHYPELVGELLRDAETLDFLRMRLYEIELREKSFKQAKQVSVQTRETGSHVFSKLFADDGQYSRLSTFCATIGPPRQKDAIRRTDINTSNKTSIAWSEASYDAWIKRYGITDHTYLSAQVAELIGYEGACVHPLYWTSTLELAERTDLKHIVCRVHHLTEHGAHVDVMSESKDGRHQYQVYHADKKELLLEIDCSETVLQ